MKTLIIMRHAKSSWDNARLRDHDRPLQKRGERDAPIMGQLLADRGLVPDMILSSSAERALVTAKAVAASAGYDGPIEVAKDFYMAGPETFVDRLRQIPNSIKSVMIVGHNPGLEDLLAELVGLWQRMPTAAVAEVSLAIDDWTQLNIDMKGKLNNLWTPKELRE